MKLVDQEVVWVFGLDVPVGQCFGRKVAQVRKRSGDRRTDRSTLQAQRRTGRSAGTVAEGEIRRAAHRGGDEKALADLGGIAEILPKAPPAMKARLYASLGVRLEYDHMLKRVGATAEAACVPGRVRRGT